MSAEPLPITVGRITGIFGVRGWLKVQSYTRPPENLLRYQPWILLQAGVFHEREVLASQPHGKGFVALLDGCSNPATAHPWVGSTIAVARAVFPPPPDGEYYWADLINLRVITRDGIDLGRVDYLIETGANDVLVVQGERERLIPYLPGVVVQAVNLAVGQLVVNWDAEF